MTCRGPRRLQVEGHVICFSDDATLFMIDCSSNTDGGELLPIHKIAVHLRLQW